MKDDALQIRDADRATTTGPYTPAELREQADRAEVKGFHGAAATLRRIADQREAEAVR